jgi:hypothetical protein
MSACRECGKYADYSAHLLVSTKGISPRIQKLSPAVPICRDCIQAVCGEQVTRLPAGMLEALQKAYAGVMKAITEKSGAR